MNIFRIIISTAVGMIGVHGTSNATSYYVDASTGNDAWSGKLATASGNDGPWQTLEKVSSAQFQAGDVVLLRCGSAWNATLRIASSGTATNPISVGAYPTPCATPPAIEGRVAIPSYAWVAQGNAIFKAQVPADLLRNSSFSTSLANWTLWSASGDATFSQKPDCGTTTGACMSVTSGSNSGAIASSNTFALSGASQYSIGFSMKIPAGKAVRVTVRRAGPTWESVGYSQSIIGTGAWQTVNAAFRATTSVSAARLDFEVPGAMTTVQIDNAWVNMPPAAKIHQLFDSGKPLDVAHHPNAGFNSANSKSLYLSMAQNANSVSNGSGTGSTYLVTGGDLVLPPGASLTAGITAFVRSAPWYLEEKTVASVSGSSLGFASPTIAPLKAGFGYFLTGAAWMLDSPGEWYYSPEQKSVFVRMPDSSAPAGRVSVSQLDTAIDLSGQSYITVDGLDVRGTRVGARLLNSYGVIMRNMAFRDIAAEGMDAQGARSAEIASNTFHRTGRDAIYAVGGAGTASSLRISGNDVSESGVRLEAGVTYGLPSPSVAAIRGGQNAQITGNRVVGTGNVGIYPLAGSTVSDNYVESSCITLDDCGGIYTFGADNGSTISGNLIRNLPGTTDGTPNTSPHTAGIYLDVHSSGITVSGNTVLNAMYGIQLHNASWNRIENNLLYGNTVFQLFLQEHTADLDAGGDVHDNTVLGNQMIPSESKVSVSHDTAFSATDRFASYDRNTYSALLSPNIAREWWSSGNFIYTLPTWQSATVSGVPRNLDPMGTQIRQLGVTSFEVAGSNLIANRDFSTGLTGWSSPYGAVTSESTCPTAPCMGYRANTAVTVVKLVSSPNFSLMKDHYYRVSFDFKTETDGQMFGAEVRRGGGGSNGYETMTGAPEPLAGSTSWQRHQFVFKALKTVNRSDPVTGDYGARLDFEKVAPSQKIYIDNVEIVPLSPVGTPVKTRALVNGSRSTTAIECPTIVSDPSACGMFVRFPEATSVTWPHAVPPMSAEVIYTVDRTSLDADSDGIPDTQDLCPGSPAGAHTDSKGCALGQ